MNDHTKQSQQFQKLKIEDIREPLFLEGFAEECMLLGMEPDGVSEAYTELNRRIEGESNAG
jgi:hypothetical protein